VTRRPSLPGASELFRLTTAATDAGAADVPAQEPSTQRRGTGRQKHSTKITVYVSDEELLALEHARLALRGEHGLAVDRGRVVREAIAIVLDDLEGHGEDSLLVRRLREQ
jgi:L-aminopeptidase/D-esterase-like protein